jgi:hypothetical protein
MSALDARRALRNFFVDARDGAEMQPAHDVMNDFMVTDLTKGFLIMSITLSLGSTIGEGGAKCPEDLSVAGLEASPELFLGYFPPAAVGSKIGHYAALVEKPGGTPSPVVKVGDFYEGTVTIGISGLVFEIVDTGQYPWGRPDWTHPANRALCRWSASLGVHPPPFTTRNHLLTCSRTLTLRLLARSMGSRYRTVARSIQCFAPCGA